MKSLISNYHNQWDNCINNALINKEYDKPLIEYIKDSLKSLEVVDAININKFEYTEKESEIDINSVILKRQKKTKKRDRFDYKLIEDNRCGKVTAYIDIKMLETDPKTGENKLVIYPIKKSILIPIEDENGFYVIGGKKYYMIYQMLEKSTYTSSNSITLKSLMPITLTRNTDNFDDIDGVTHNLPMYTVKVFKNDIPLVLFYLARGLSWALDYFGMDDIIFIDSSQPDQDEYDEFITFKISSKLYMKVRRKQMRHSFVQSVVGGILHVSSNRLTEDALEDPETWIKKITNPPNLKKGQNIINSFGRLLDEATKKILKIPDIYKKDIYSILLWLSQHFNELRLKDNCDLSNKRLRCNEYIASLLNKEFSSRLNRILTMGDKATIDNIKEIFKFSGDILLNKLHTSGILRFDDTVNDQNFWSKLKYTNKGPNSLGNTNSNNIPIKYRDLHPSMLGEIDILVCGNSDPGTSGLLSPFANINGGMCFDGSEEESSFIYKMAKELEEMYKDKGINYISIECDNQKDYYEILDKLRHYYETSNVYGTSKENDYQIILQEKTHDMDDQSVPSTVLLRKNK